MGERCRCTTLPRIAWLGVTTAANAAAVTGSPASGTCGCRRPPLFPANTTRIAARRSHFLRGYAYRFIEMCSPTLSEDAVRGDIAPAGNGAIV